MKINTREEALRAFRGKYPNYHNLDCRWYDEGIFQIWGYVGRDEYRFVVLSDGVILTAEEYWVLTKVDVSLLGYFYARRTEGGS
jgi:hypothetical protein